MRVFLTTILVLAVASCGVQRPLMRPKDIPAYEKQQQEKLKKIEQENRELEEIDAKAKAEKAAAAKTEPTR